MIPQDTVPGKNQPVKQPEYFTSRLVTEKPVIDGKLDDECWKTGTWAGDYTQWKPDEGAKPTYPTELNIQYDDKYLYIAFRAHDDEPDKIHRYAGVRDEIVGDMMGLTIDSYRDYRTGFEFTITAWGQKVDQMHNSRIVGMRAQLINQLYTGCPRAFVATPALLGVACIDRPQAFLPLITYYQEEE